MCLWYVLAGNGGKGSRTNPLLLQGAALAMQAGQLTALTRLAFRG